MILLGFHENRKSLILLVDISRALGYNDCMNREKAMKVYVIYDREGWEILGIEKCFASRASAEKYIDEWYALYCRNHVAFGKDGMTRAEWDEKYNTANAIHEIEVT